MVARRAWCSAATPHRGIDYQLATAKKRKRRSLGTHLLAQSANGAAEKEEEGGGFNGAGDSQFGGS